MKIIKRDGRKLNFNPIKIENAVIKLLLRLMVSLLNMQLRRLKTSLPISKIIVYKK